MNNTDAMGAVLAAVLAFSITALLGIVMIPFLKKLKFGQNIKEIGPVWHKSKQGTPIMGGLMFIAGILISIITVFVIFSAVSGNQFLLGQETAKIIGGIFMALALGFIGFMDDYIKVVKKRNLGLTAKQKLFAQFITACIYLLIEYISGARGTTFTIPFFNTQLDFGIFYWPVAVFIILAFDNAVNLTDGIDGLCSSVTFLVAIALMLSSKIMGLYGYSIISAALAGGLLGFLVWNFHPAKVFMGDTGSLFLGGIICAIAFGVGQPLILVPMGLIYICEVLSVVIQVISFKTTGKRVFKMSPIHHHFEMSGWSEVRIVGAFSLITAVCSAATVIWLAFYMGFTK